MLIELGKVVGVWGVKGWIKLHSYTREREDIGSYSQWWLQNEKQQGKPVNFQVLVCRVQGQGIVAQLENISTPEQAAELIGRRILIEKSDLPALPKGEFYWRQLIGLEVTNLADESLGKIESLLETGANDVLVLKQSSEQKSEEVLIPYAKEFIKSVDLTQGTMIVDWDLRYLD